MADKPHGHVANQTADIAGRITSRMAWFQRGLSLWVQRRLSEESLASAGTGHTGAALTVAHTQSLVGRVQRLPEQSTVWRPNVGSLDPRLTDRFARKITERFADTGSRYQIQRRAPESAESDSLPLAGLQQEEAAESDTSFVETLPFSVEEVRRALEKGPPATRSGPGRPAAEAPVQRTPGPSGQPDRQFPFTLDEVRAALEKKPASGSPPGGQTISPGQRQTGKAPPVTPARPLPSRMRRFSKIEEITPGETPAEVTPPEPPAVPESSPRLSETEREAARTEEPTAQEPVQRHPDRESASSQPLAQGEVPSKTRVTTEPEPPEMVDSQPGLPQAASSRSTPDRDLPLRRPESSGLDESAGEQPPAVEAEIRRDEAPPPVIQPKEDEFPAGQEPEPGVKAEPSPAAAPDQPVRRTEGQSEPSPAETARGEGLAPEAGPGGEVPPPVVQVRRDEMAPDPKPVVRPDLDRPPEEELPLRRPESGEEDGTADVPSPTGEAEIRRAEGPSPVVQPKAVDTPAGQEPEPEVKPQPSLPAASEQPARRTVLDAGRPPEATGETAPSGGEEPTEAEVVETRAGASGPVVQAQPDEAEAEPGPVVQPELDRSAEPDLPLRGSELAEGRKPEPVERPVAEPGPAEQAEGPGLVVHDEESGPGPVILPDLEQDAEQEFPLRRLEPGEVATPEAPAAGSAEPDEGPASESVEGTAVEMKPATQVEGSPPVVQAKSEAEKQESKPVVQPELDEAAEPELPLRTPESVEGRTPGPVEGPAPETGPAEQTEAPPVAQTRTDEAQSKPVVPPDLDKTSESEMPLRTPEPVEGRRSVADDERPAESDAAPAAETKATVQTERPSPEGQETVTAPGSKPVVQPTLDRAAEPQMPLRTSEPGEERTAGPGEGRRPESAGEAGPEVVAEPTVERRPSPELSGPADEPSQPPRPVGQAKREDPPERGGPALTLRPPEPAKGGVEADSAAAPDQEVMARTKSGSDLLVTRPLDSIQRVLDKVSRPEKTAVLPQARGETGFSEEENVEVVEAAVAWPVSASRTRGEGALPLAAPPRPVERVPAGTTTRSTPSVPASAAAVQRQEVETVRAAQPVEPAVSSQPPAVVQRAETEAPASTAPETESREPDLDKLARQILPLIKRLLAVERDRRPFR